MVTTDDAPLAWLVEAATLACRDVVAEAAHVPLEHWNESVFRFFLVRRLLAARPSRDCRTEWNRVDLVIPASDGAHGTTLVELKFFGAVPLRDHTGRHLRWKGKPGPQNRREVAEAVAKLRRARAQSWVASCGGVAHAVLVLAFWDPREPSGRPTFAADYAAYAPGGDITRVHRLIERAPAGPDAELTCLLLEIALDAAT